MKNFLVIAALALSGMPAVYAQTMGIMGKQDGIGAGGAGGNPRTFGTTSFNEPLVTPSSVGETEFTTTTTTSLPTRLIPTDRDKTVLVNREELLKAVDAALNANDLEMDIEDKPSTIRLQKFDLSRGILHGKILETDRPIRLIDQTKAIRVAPGS